MDEHRESTAPGDESLGAHETVDVSASENSRRYFRSHKKSELITDAQPSRYANRKRRSRWYMFLQISRLPTTLLAAFSYFYWDNLWLTVIFFILAFPAPALAVVIANEPREKIDKRERNVYKPAIARQQLQQAEQQRLSAGSSGMRSLGSSEDPTSFTVVDDDSAQH